MFWIFADGGVFQDAISRYFMSILPDDPCRAVNTSADFHRIARKITDILPP